MVGPIISQGPNSFDKNHYWSLGTCALTCINVQRAGCSWRQWRSSAAKRIVGLIAFRLAVVDRYQRARSQSMAPTTFYASPRQGWRRAWLDLSSLRARAKHCGRAHLVWMRPYGQRRLVLWPESKFEGVERALIIRLNLEHK